MILVDANVLIYAVNSDTQHHQPARGWLHATMSGEETLGLPWTSLLAFLRITTNPRILPTPLTPGQAGDVMSRWLEQPTCVVVEPGPRHVEVLCGLLVQSGTAGNLTNDAHLAALALERRAAVASFDRDLERFDVRVIVPGQGRRA